MAHTVCAIRENNNTHKVNNSGLMLLFKFNFIICRGFSPLMHANLHNLKLENMKYVSKASLGFCQGV